MSPEQQIEQVKDKLNYLRKRKFVFFSTDYSNFETESKFILEQILYLKEKFEMNTTEFKRLKEMEDQIRDLNEFNTKKRLRRSTNAKKPRNR